MKLQLLALLLILIGSNMFSAVHAQEPSNITQLRDEVAKLSLVDRNPDTSPELRMLNKSVLNERGNRLRTLLANRISELHTYRRLVTLSDAESRALDGAIRQIETELRKLDENAASDGTKPVTIVDSATASSTAVTSGKVPPTGGSGSGGRKGKPDTLTIRVDNQVDMINHPLDTLIRTINSDNKGFEGKVGDSINYYLAELDRYSTTSTAGKPEGELKKRDYYCVVHIVKWAGAKVTEDGWFLFKSDKPDAEHLDKTSAWTQQTDFDGKRIYGSKNVGLLIFHIDAPYPGGDISYKIAVNKKTPAPISDVLTLLGTITSAKAAPTKSDLYAAQVLTVEDVPSDLVITASMAIQDQQSQVLTRTYDNEGRYHWDVSVGVPVKTIRELQFNAEGGKVTAVGKDRQDVYGFLNIYPWAVDVKDQKALTPPHFLIGVPLASKPLQHPFAGIGIGIYKAPIKFNVFAGIVFNRELVPRTLTTGSTATPSQLESDLHPRWVQKFSWGINFPISQLKDAFKK